MVSLSLCCCCTTEYIISVFPWAIVSAKYRVSRYYKSDLSCHNRVHPVEYTTPAYSDIMHRVVCHTLPDTFLFDIHSDYLMERRNLYRNISYSPIPSSEAIAHSFPEYRYNFVDSSGLPVLSDLHEAYFSIPCLYEDEYLTYSCAYTLDAFSNLRFYYLKNDISMVSDTIKTSVSSLVGSSPFLYSREVPIDLLVKLLPFVSGCPTFAISYLDSSSEHFDYYEVPNA